MPVNLVFQGGGVRGVAYAGALESLPNDMSIDGVAGTSAGSIVAALLAIGKSQAEIAAILQDHDLFSLLVAADAERYARIRTALDRFKPLLDRIISGKKPPLTTLWKLRQTLRTLTADLDAVWQARGLHSSAPLGQWLNRILEGKTFDQANAVDQLKIVAADVSRQRYKIYSKHDGPMPLANAVYASVSIPIFFVPYSQGVDLYVDGGLLSNYPAFVFADSRYPTIGFRLRDLLPPAGITSTVSYLKALLQTMAEAHDKERKLPRHYFQYDIITPPHIPFDKFDLTETDVLELLNAGRQVGQTVRWKDHERRERRVAFFDPDADETLDFSVSQARALYDAYTSESLWVDELAHDAEFVVHLEQDWSATYDRYGTFTVSGDKPLILQRFRAGSFPQPGAPLSLMDVHCVCEEISTVNAKVTPLLRIPAWNSDQQKGFLLFYVPPVTAAGGPRRFHTGFQVPREFESVADGESGQISYGVQPLAHKHRLKLAIRVLAHAALPRLLFSSDFGKIPAPADPVNDGGVLYNQYRLDLPERTLGGETLYNLNFRIDRGHQATSHG